MKKDHPATGERKLELLLVGQENGNSAPFSDLLDRSGAGAIHWDEASSAEEAATRLSEKEYDLMMYLPDPGNGLANMELDRLRRDHPAVPGIWLSENTLGPAIQATIRSKACSLHRNCDSAAPCQALALLSVIAEYQKARQRRTFQNSLHQLKRAVEQSPDLVMITDRSGIIEYVNPAFETVTGYKREEVTGQVFGMLKSEQHPGELYEEMWDTVLSGKVFRGIVTHRKKNGDSFVVEKIMTSLLDSQGQITHFICTGRDISDRRKLEAQLQQAQKMDAIGRLAGGVAHDFNNLLMVISAYAELMLESLSTEHPLRRNVGEIMTASRRAADLTRQLLAFSRKQMQSLQVLDLNAVIGEINGMLPRLIGEDIELAFIPGVDLGKVKADPVQIEQVIMNLAVNARDAMPKGGHLTIETGNVRVDEAYLQRRPIVPLGDYVLLAVTDSGEGIAPEHLAHIFEPFYTTKEAGKGTGLGLATVYGIVKQNGGYIWVYSELGLGTTFKIYLPRVQSASEKVAAAQGLSASPRGCETLLLVEDEAAVRRSTHEYLTQHGYNVLEAGNGEEALRLSREYCGPIQLLVSDVVMPNMGGVQLAGQLAAERPNIQVLFVSGYAENTVLRHGKIDVTARFLQKPFSLAALARKIREVLDHEPSRGFAVSSSASSPLAADPFV